MSTSSTSVDGAISSLASAIFKRADANSDGGLTSTEFESFLNGLLRRVGDQQTPSATKSVKEGPTSSRASAIFNRIDTNGDSSLAGGEFQSFIKGMLREVRGHQSPEVGSGVTANSTQTLTPPAASTRTLTAPAVTQTITPPSWPVRGYQGMTGFDYAKLNDPEHKTPKYVFARATQEVQLPWDRESRSKSLQQIADYVKQNGYPEAKVIGDDTIDFGGDVGAIDVLTGDGQWWWGPKAA